MKEKLKEISKDKCKILIFIIIVIGILVRIINISNIPNALNNDEASAGYEAFSILNYGIDRNGNTIPAFLVSWGSGQNVLLTYLIIPFIKIFGLNLLSVRLPMAILGSISLVIMYLLLKKISNKKIATIGLAFFSICPWHIIKSRWGLESNLFPDLILIFVYLVIKGIEDKNKILYYISFVVAGLTAYAYGTSYFFLPMFLIPILIILVRKKEIDIKQAIISILIVGIITLPIILFVIINTFNLQQLNLEFLTIPKLEVNRYQEITSIFSGNFLKTSLSNFIESLKIIIFQSDGLQWNSIKPFGIIYNFSIIFTIIGLVYSFKDKESEKIKYSYIFNIWFIVSIILSFICEPNINRLNIIMIPIVYYTIIGIYEVITSVKDLKKQKSFIILISIIYLIFFTLFIKQYIKQDWNNYSTFENGLEEVIQYVDSIEDKEIYITNKIKEPYIYVLFYTKYNTRDFVETVEYYDEHVEFRQVKTFGKYHFESIKQISKDNIYLIKKEDLNNYNINLEQYKITEFEKYVVIEGE